MAAPKKDHEGLEIVFLDLFITCMFSDHGHNENFRACVMMIQKEILNQSKSITPGYTF